jgi:hypothetical protein
MELLAIHPVEHAILDCIVTRTGKQEEVRNTLNYKPNTRPMK